MNKTILRVEGLTAAYGDRNILNDVTFSMEAGKLTALLGVNGVGKTMLLKCLAQRLPHQGSCQLESTCLEHLSVRELAKRISYIPQRSGLQISLPVLDVVMMAYNPWLGLLEHPSQGQKQKALEALAAVGSSELAEQDYQTLSEGQKQLVYLARTLIEQSKLLLLDEPDSALDFQNRHQILYKLRNLVEKEQKTALLCLHDPQLALRFCHKLLLLKDGAVLTEIDIERDTVEHIEKALRQLYGRISLLEHCSEQGKRQLLLLWEDGSWSH